MTLHPGWTRLDRAMLAQWPLPEVPCDADKEERGRALVIAGSREIPGAAVLAATAALRAGAGKLVIATARSAAPHIAIAVPEARVIGLPETASGGLSLEGLLQLRECVAEAACVLVGPGLVDEAATIALVGELLPLLHDTPAVIDALALKAISRGIPTRTRVVATPHAGEMAGLRSQSKGSVQRDPQETALEAAQEWNAIVALKGATTLLAHPDGRRWRHEGANPGLATSGSGDVLAGIVTGLLARGAAPEQAAAWGIVLHALAGAALERRLGPLGYLARELAGEVPALMCSP